MTRPAPSKLVLLGAVMFVALPLAALAPFNDPYLSCAFLGSFVLHMWARPRLAEVAGTSLVATLLAVLHVTFQGPKGLLSMVPMAAGDLLGLASLIVLAVPRLLGSVEERKAHARILAAAAAVPTYVIISNFALKLTRPFHSATYDLYLYAFDNTLGFQPSFWVGQFVSHSRWLPPICLGIYYGLPLGVVLLYVGAGRTRKMWGRIDLLLVFAIAGTVGCLLFQTLPAVGPVYIFPRQFPYDPPPPEEVGLSLVSPSQSFARNAMPSMHASWVLLMWWNSRTSALWVRALSGGFVLFTILATLGFGEHYLIDLVVAVPFTLAMQAACSTSVPLKEAPRLFGVCLGGGLTLGWLGLLRSLAFLHFGVISSWTLVAATVLAPVVSQRYLALAERRAGKRESTAT